MIAAEFPDALVALTEDCPPGLAQARDHRDRRAGKAAHSQLVTGTVLQQAEQPELLTPGPGQANLTSCPSTRSTNERAPSLRMQSCDRLYDTEIRKVICPTNAIKSPDARSRRAVRARGHFPDEQATLRCLYPATRSPGPAGAVRTRWAMRCKPAINAFAITSGGRFPAAGTC